MRQYIMSDIFENMRVVCNGGQYKIQICEKGGLLWWKYVRWMDLDMFGIYQVNHFTNLNDASNELWRIATGVNI